MTLEKSVGHPVPVVSADKSSSAAVPAITQQTSRSAALAGAIDRYFL